MEVCPKYMKSKLTVSVGISAYNEQVNIANVITSLLYQQESNFSLKEIIVVSDGSVDKTVELVKGFGDHRVKLFVHDNRGGKAKRLNEIFNFFTGDILFLTDADVLPDDQNVIARIVEQFEKNEKVDLVLANVRPLPAINFFEGAVNNFFYARESQSHHFDFLTSIHGARGAGMALRQYAAKQIEMPESLIIDDAYIYLYLKQHAYKVAAAKDALIWFRSVQTPGDFKKQIMRYMRGGEQLHTFFPDELILKESYIPKMVMFRLLADQIKKNIVGYFYLKFVFMYCRLYLKYYKYKTSPKWLISKSSKQLQVQPGLIPSQRSTYGKIFKAVGVLKGIILVWLTN